MASWRVEDIDSYTSSMLTVGWFYFGSPMLSRTADFSLSCIVVSTAAVQSSEHCIMQSDKRGWAGLRVRIVVDESE